MVGRQYFYQSHRKVVVVQVDMIFLLADHQEAATTVDLVAVQ